VLNEIISKKLPNHNRFFIRTLLPLKGKQEIGQKSGNPAFRKAASELALAYHTTNLNPIPKENLSLRFWSELSENH